MIVRNRRAGRHTGQFLLLGSASIDLLKKSARRVDPRSAMVSSDLDDLDHSALARFRGRPLKLVGRGDDIEAVRAVAQNWATPLPMQRLAWARLLYPS